MAFGVSLNHERTSFLSLSLKVESRCRILNFNFLNDSSTRREVSIPALKINVLSPAQTSS